MTRDEVRDTILKLKNPYILCELPTGFGKSKIAIDWLLSRVPVLADNTKILIVVPRLVLIQNWKDELKKWKCQKYIPYITFVTYISLPKLCDRFDYSAVIFDEAHHLSERCREALDAVDIPQSMLLSATVGKNFKWDIKALFKGIYAYKISARKAIEEEVLPDPTVFLVPLVLNNTKADCQIVKNKSLSKSITVEYKDRFKYAKVKNQKVIIKCTQRQCYNEMTSLIEWYKRKIYDKRCEMMFLQKSGERLKWLSEQKESVVKEVLNTFDKERTLTFCKDIAQTEKLGKYCVNSKNTLSKANLEKFNTGLINHITACNMLDEGVNLSDCRIGIYAMLNSSERMIKQKLGRLLRHPKPVIIIPFFLGTRDEEIVNKMLQDYNPDLVYRINNIKEIRLS